MKIKSQKIRCPLTFLMPILKFINPFLISLQTISLVCLVYYLFRYVGHKIIEDSPEYKGIVYGGFVLYGFMIVTSLVIIPGVQLVRYL